MTVENVGFFREFPHGDPQGPSLRESMGKGDVEARDGVAGYLANGSLLATTGEHVSDVLKDEKVDAGLLAIQTDGRWVWPADLAYYVREYNVQLPVHFVDWARAAAWTPPQLSSEELVQVEKSLFPESPA
jgi:hypothetical protein